VVAVSFDDFDAIHAVSPSGPGLAPGNRFEAVGTRFDRDNRISIPTVCF
jgi:hypothetical protein